ncbi:MAG: P63C domain-containing protein [Nitrospirae bacterium]|nr:P63C domain-containing protein [Nitrospirota bacterium]
MAELGASKGGEARAKKLTPEQRSDIASRAAEARWAAEGKVPPLRATHEGILRIGKMEIPAAVLENGQRVLTQSGFMRALGRARQAKGREYYDGDVNLPAFLTAQNLKPFISKDLEVTSSQIEFKPLRGHRAFGYPAELLPKVCDVFLDAEKAGMLTSTQKHIAERAHLLIRGLAHVGIVALVDEATRYQEVRDRLALQAILDAFLEKELAAWAKRFPDEFYQELFRLKGWEWKSITTKRPRHVGKLTKSIVYARLAPGIVKELEGRNPVDEKGYRKNRHHQWLTEDVGHPALAQHLHAVIALMRVNTTWDDFYVMLNRAFPKRGDTLQLPFMGDV